MQGDVTTYVYLTFQKTTLFVFKALFMLKSLDPPFAGPSAPQLRRYPLPLLANLLGFRLRAGWRADFFATAGLLLVYFVGR